MPDNDIENIDSLNGAEAEQENGQDGQPDNVPTLEDYNALKEKAEKLEKTNRKFYTRLKQFEGLKTAPVQDERLADLELKMELKDKGIPLETMDFIKKNGGLKALEDPIVKTAVEAYTNQLRAEKAVDGDSASKSDIEKRHTLAEMATMPLEDLEKLVR